MGSSSSDNFSVLVLASDLGVDARPFLNNNPPETENRSSELQNHDFSDLDALGFLRLEKGCDIHGNRIFRIVGKYFSAPTVPVEVLRKYVVHKMMVWEGPFCMVYLHSATQKEDNSPGIMVLRWIYEEVAEECKERLRVVYFVHPGLRSRLVLATLGRLFLSGGLYWKIKYVSRLQYLWEDIKKGEMEIPEFVKKHDDILEHRPLTDYGIEPDHFRVTDIPAAGGFSSYARRESS
ncbi:hypothetical protein M569_00575, partial [Genlisea aurea]